MSPPDSDPEALSGEFELAPFRLEDLEQVLELEEASFPDDAFSEEIFLSQMAVSPRGFIVARRGGSVVGYVLATERRGQGLIMSIAVSPEFRRRGLGTLLMSSALSYLATKFKAVYLQVDAEHEETIRFYRKHSFVETGRVLKRYYPNGHDALEMVRRL